MYTNTNSRLLVGAVLGIAIYLKMVDERVTPYKRAHMGGLLEAEREEGREKTGWGQRLVPRDKNGGKERGREKEKEKVMGGGQACLLKGNVASVHKRCS